MSLFSLQGHGALVTGSSRGIGFAIGKGLHEAGAEVVFHGTKNRPKDIPPTCPYVNGDLRSVMSPRDIITAARKRLSKLDLLVCNAGSFYDVPFREMNMQRWKNTMDVYLTGNYFLIQEFSKILWEEGQSGSVVLIADTSGMQADHDCTAYDIAKAGMIGMVKTLSVALGHQKIRVNGLAPGVIDTDFTHERLGKSPERVADYEQKFVLERFGSAADCVGAAIFLCSDASSYITGQTLAVDGGLGASRVGRKPKA
ncbi:MAG: short-chain dehydrogenase [Verrucomicrobia bacterium]|jgi:NAD(P)-dependent dehydrogenase (short-subunit alcohol dehydrogenase family)|nr:short-chain dehydrogenase [Verrucomicrobiota bacterium]